MTDDIANNITTDANVALMKHIIATGSSSGVLVMMVALPNGKGAVVDVDISVRAWDSATVPQLIQRFVEPMLASLREHTGVVPVKAHVVDGT